VFFERVKQSGKETEREKERERGRERQRQREMEREREGKKDWQIAVQGNSVGEMWRARERVS
jgi:hypothetical protein